MSALPLAVRVAAGLAATAVERARRLPQDLAGLPVTAVSRAMQVSMRVQQQITELAIRGDNAIALLRTPSEDPPWAVFDEDEASYRPPDDLPDATAEVARDWQDAEGEDNAAAAETGVITETDRTPAESPHTPPETNHAPSETNHAPADTNHAQAEAHPTPGISGEYAELSLASLRGRLRTFGIDELQAMVDYELTHLNRPEFVRMLTNRIKTVRDQ